MKYLDEILEAKRNIIHESTPAQLKNQCSEHIRDIRELKKDKNLDVIAEIKRKSPSKGDLAIIEDVAGLAMQYEIGGACAISVLTDAQYFGAKEDDLNIVRDAVKLPVLRKDFLVCIEDVYESYLMQADIILLIVAAFDDIELIKEMFGTAKKLGLEVLVETHSKEELEVAIDIGANLIGVNVRDLKTFEEKPEIGEQLIKSMPSKTIRVWESSIRSIHDANFAASIGSDIVLVGQGLIQSENPAHFIEQMRNISPHRT
jgi:indole-3-glycerol phosphate synthase